MLIAIALGNRPSCSPFHSPTHPDEVSLSPASKYLKMQLDSLSNIGVGLDWLAAVS